MAINPKELRIGNFITSTVYTRKVRAPTAMMEIVTLDVFETALMRPGENAAQQDAFVDMSYSELEPVRLTADLLERAGFKLVDEVMASGIDGIKGPFYAKDSLLLWSNGSEPKDSYLVYYASGEFGKYRAVYGRWINSLHDLQNTFYSWRGQELTIKP
jgi:hypothetical protein